MFYKTIFTLFGVLLFSVSYTQSLDSRLFGLEEEIIQLMNTHKTVGMSIAIVENSEVILSKGFGHRNLERRLPVDENTLFPVGSVTKPLTASLIGIYMDRGDLKVHDRPMQFIKDLRFQNDIMDNLITMEDLLSHRSGIGVVDGAHVFFPTGDIKKHLTRLAYLTPNSQVRERFDYSNMGFAILGAVTESITKRTWDENIHNEILSPLEMNLTNCSLKDLTSSDNYSLGYSIANDSIVHVLYEDQYESKASGAINSTSLELSNWVRMLLNAGKYEGNQILSKEYIEHSFSEHNIIRESFSFEKKNDLLFDTYGYGWFVHQNRDLYRVNHGGNVSGFSSIVTLYPHRNVGIIILTNQGSSNLLTKAIEEIISRRLFNSAKKNLDEYQIEIGQANLLKKQIQSINTEKPPSLPLANYCGRYSNRGYGEINVKLQSGKLEIEFPVAKMALEHHSDDTFLNRLLIECHQNIPTFLIDFQANNAGKISELSIGFQNEPVVFLKSLTN